jgi:hypothetical protein
MSLTHDDKEFRIAEPVLKQQDRSVVCDWDAGVIVALQALVQLLMGNLRQNW